jgi:hypothetical protein
MLALASKARAADRVESTGLGVGTPPDVERIADLLAPALPYR